MTFGVPVDPLLQMPLVAIPMTSGCGSADCASASAINAGRSSGRTLSRPSTTSSSRSRSHAGRSQRTGTGTAPIFQAANTSNTSSVELMSSIATRSPLPTPRCVNARASCSVRRSSSRHVVSSSWSSGRTRTSAGWSGCAAARPRIRRLNGIGVSSSVVTVVREGSGADAVETVAQAGGAHDLAAAFFEGVVLRLLQVLAGDARGFLGLPGHDRREQGFVRRDDVALIFLDRIVTLGLRALRPLPLLLGPEALECADHEDQRLVAARGDELLVEAAGQDGEARTVAEYAFALVDVGLQLGRDGLLAVRACSAQ